MKMQPEWQPLDTAPRDGTYILALGNYADHPRAIVARFSTFHPHQPGKLCWRSAETARPLEYLVQWQPLPEIPQG